MRESRTCLFKYIFGCLELWFLFVILLFYTFSLPFSLKYMILFSQDGCSYVPPLTPSLTECLCSSPPRMEAPFPPLAIGRALLIWFQLIEYGISDAVWLARLGQGRPWTTFPWHIIPSQNTQPWHCQKPTQRDLVLLSSALSHPSPRAKDMSGQVKMSPEDCSHSSYAQIFISSQIQPQVFWAETTCPGCVLSKFPVPRICEYDKMAMVACQ